MIVVRIKGAWCGWGQTPPAARMSVHASVGQYLVYSKCNKS